MAKPKDYMKTYRAQRKANNSEPLGGAKLKSGEESYVIMPPTKLNKTGKTVVAKTENDEYIYKVNWDKSEKKIDKTSTEYQRALRDYNVKATFNSDGTVSVTKGGIFSRKVKFKTISAFEKEVNKRLDGYKNYYDNSAKLTKSGRISQLKAEVLKGYIRNDTPNALKKFNKEMQDSLLSARTRSAAAQDMKERLYAVIDKAKKK